MPTILPRPSSSSWTVSQFPSDIFSAHFCPSINHCLISSCSFCLVHITVARPYSRFVVTPPPFSWESSSNLVEPPTRPKHVDQMLTNIFSNTGCNAGGIVGPLEAFGVDWGHTRVGICSNGGKQPVSSDPFPPVPYPLLVSQATKRTDPLPFSAPATRSTESWARSHITALRLRTPKFAPASGTSPTGPRHTS